MYTTTIQKENVFNDSVEINCTNIEQSRKLNISEIHAFSYLLFIYHSSNEEAT